MTSKFETSSDLEEEHGFSLDPVQSNEKGGMANDQMNLRRSHFDQKLSDEIVANMGTKLPEDVYSMIFVARLWSYPFFFAMFCVCFQFLIIWLLIYNEFDFESSDNKFKIPFRVSTTVTVAQCLGIYLAVCNSNDLLEVCELISGGHPSHITKELPSATRTKWYFSRFAKLLEGSLCTFVIFMLVIQSSEIVPLFLNFAALTFVWDIDNIFFGLAAKGFYSQDITKCAANVSAITIPPPSKKSLYIRNTIFNVIVVGFLAIWANFVHRQYTGQYTSHLMCKSLLVQFDDAYEPLSSRFSGVYSRLVDKISDRVVYENKNLPQNPLGISEETRKNAYIAYCQDSATWTLSVVESRNIDPCNETTKLAQSKKTQSFEITDDGDATWFTKRREKARYVPYDFKIIECLDCDNDLNPLRSSCSESGQCVDGKCKCKKGHFGLSCEFSTPCETLVPYGDIGFRDKCYNQQGGDEGDALQYDANFTLLRLNNTTDFVTINDKPVYYQEFDKNIRKDCNDAPGGGGGGQVQPPPQQPPLPKKLEVGLLFFSGFRWVLIDASDIKEFEFNASSSNNKSKLAAYMKKSFHPVFSNYTAKYYSDPTKHSTNGEQFTPKMLSWYSAVENLYLKYPTQGTPGSPVLSFQPMICGEPKV